MSPKKPQQPTATSGTGAPHTLALAPAGAHRFTIEQILEYRELSRYVSHPNKFTAIRLAYAKHMPHIMAHRERSSLRSYNPYFHDWKFTPIEDLAWQDIRGAGIPLLPQVPVGRRFVDFGDPYYRIAVEMDGAAYHQDADKDIARDHELLALGWRVFHLPGYTTPVRGWSPFEDPDRLPMEIFRDEAFTAQLWTWLRDTSTGFFFGLKAFYFEGDPRTKLLQHLIPAALRSRTLIDFDLEIVEAV